MAYAFKKVAEEAGDFTAWLDARCVLVRCAMPLQLRLYGMKVRHLGAISASNALNPKKCVVTNLTPWQAPAPAVALSLHARRHRHRYPIT